MSGRSRTVVCSQNLEFADFLSKKREQYLAENNMILAKSVERACNGVCDHLIPITTPREALRVKHLGTKTLKLLEPLFDGRNSAPTPQPALENTLGPNGKAKKKYCPAKRSAAYALLITLLRAHQKGKPFMMKQELIDEGDKSGLSAKPIRPNALSWNMGQPNGREFYSGWNGMKTLIEKCLVVRSSNPAKYKLTVEGTALAQQCMERGGLIPNNSVGHETVRDEEPRGSPAPQGSGESGPRRLESSSSDDEIQEIRRSDLRQRNNSLFGGGESGPRRLESASSDDDVQEIRTSDLRQRNNSLFSSSQGGMRVDGQNPAPSRLKPPANTSRQSSHVASGTVSGYPAPSKPRASENTSRQPPPVASGIEVSARAGKTGLSRNNLGPFPVPAINVSAVQRNGNVEIGTVDPDFELAVPPLQAGEKFADVYEVICILDNREKFRTGSGKAAHTLLQRFADSLKTQFNVKVEPKSLPVGDALWIARHKRLDEEYVLDFVVERKNVNDLWSSIKDNRYRQQKLRLLNCGLNGLLYLVEGDVNTIESTDSLKTAMFTTEMEGFRILRTDDTSHTCRQYGEVTRAIISRYNMETGKGGKSSPVCRTYNAFVEACKAFLKDRVTDVFCRQLMQISQVTEDVALSIQDRYPTLISMAQAFLELEGNQLSQEKMLQGIPIRKTSKTMSAVMSRNIYKAIWAVV